MKVIHCIIALSIINYAFSIASMVGANKWPNGIIPYQANPSHPFWTGIVGAMNMINALTRVKFIERTTQGGYVVFSNNPGGNWAELGYGGERVHYCNFSGGYRFAHELSHILGFIHEVQRSDRDNFIEFLEKNLPPPNDRAWVNGNMLNREINSINLTPYDIDSIMQYWASAGGRKLTIPEILNPTIPRYNNEMVTMIYKPDRDYRFGTSENLTQKDINGINLHYFGIHPTDQGQRHLTTREKIARQAELGFCTVKYFWSKSKRNNCQSDIVRKYY
jgi:hypothetical protein